MTEEEIFEECRHYFTTSNEMDVNVNSSPPDNFGAELYKTIARHFSDRSVYHKVLNIIRYVHENSWTSEQKFNSLKYYELYLKQQKEAGNTWAWEQFTIYINEPNFTSQEIFITI